MYPVVEVRGSSKVMGFQLGRALRRQIHQIIERRRHWHQGLMARLKGASGRSYAQALLKLSRKNFPSLMDELEAMAEGAGVAFDALWGMTIKSELALVGEPSGCSTIAFPQRGWLFHNEDGDKTYRGMMVLVKAYPKDMPAFQTLVYPGILEGNGPTITESHFGLTTNYISWREKVIGIPRYVLTRALLRVESLEEALKLIQEVPKAYPFHFNFLDLKTHRYLSVEATPDRVTIVEPKTLYLHTNHLLHPDQLREKQDFTYIHISSLKRYRTLKEGIKKNPLTSRAFLKLLSSHKNAPYSPCRHPMGKVRGQTLGTAWFGGPKAPCLLYAYNPCLAVSRNHFRILDI